MRTMFRHHDEHNNLTHITIHDEGTGPDNRYWSITGETYRGPHRRESKMESCGAIHEDILAACPELEPVVRLHLSDADTGAPMYPYDNARYWLGLCTWADGSPMVPHHGKDIGIETHGSGIEWSPTGVARHFRVKLDDAQRIADWVLNDPNHTEALKFQVRAHGPYWLAQVDEARGVLAGLTST